ncbi:HHR216Cp [Eremothecium sinecaudum]|uniref:HHR216Cp n=1 Tax=Eremothecium sinecaudum TaxID=45286 RepID=A0A0X8HX15_9SACH|nr:HHR216Cp [Eremothecium sinecaudum]AMD22985.1 HHR216Cp [Eremothecium sinecaudum]
MTMEDIRYSFLNTLDHLPCEIIRTLWTMQSLELRGQRSKDALNEARYLATMLKLHRKRLEQEGGYLRELVDVSKRYGAYVEAQPQTAIRSPRRKPLKIRISLKKSHLLQKQQAVRSPKAVKQQAEQEEWYCFCRDISYGPMVACDNEKCEYEWFHYACVGLTAAPRDRDKWYCSDKCRKEASRSKKRKL